MAVQDASGHALGTAVTAADGSFVITTAFGSNLTVVITVPGSSTPKTLTISLPVGTTLNLGQVDPNDPSWIDAIQQAFLKRGPDPLQVDYGDVPPLGDCIDCVWSLSDVLTAISLEDATWQTVLDAQQGLNTAFWGSAGLLASELGLVAVDAVGLYVAAGSLTSLLGSIFRVSRRWK